MSGKKEQENRIDSLKRKKKLLSELWDQKIRLMRSVHVAPPGKMYVVQRDNETRFFVHINIEDQSGTYIFEVDEGRAKIFNKKHEDEMALEEVNAKITEIELCLIAG